jgi:DNA-binding PadR family transcriptional regulator
MDSSLALLGLLTHQPSYGYDLKQHYDRFFGLRKQLAFGQVYSTLARMVRDGFVRPVGEESGAGPDRKKYEVTPAGRERLEVWMRTPDVPSASLQSNLFAKTVVALLVDGDAEGLLDVQRAEHMARMRELTRLKQSSDVMHVLLYDHALFHIEADLRWIDLTSARLQQLEQELTSP